MSRPDDLSELMGALDEIEPAPPEFVERLWADLEATLLDRAPASAPVAVELTAPTAVRRREVRWGLLLAAASFVLVVGAGMALLLRDAPTPVVPADSGTAVTSPDAVVPPSTILLPPTTADTSAPTPAPTVRVSPTSVEAACAEFRSVIPSLEVVRAAIPAGDAGADWLATLDDALATLVGDLETLGPAAGVTDDVVNDLRISRGAFEDAADRLAEGDAVSAQNAFDVGLSRLVELTARSEQPVDGCLPLVAE